MGSPNDVKAKFCAKCHREGDDWEDMNCEGWCARVNRVSRTWEFICPQCWLSEIANEMLWG